MALPVPSPPSNSPQSARARLRCRWEPFSEVVSELWPLLKRQDAEVGGAYNPAPLEPDWDRYFEYERAGILKIWTARHDDVLAGYVVCLVVHGLHHRSTLHCYADLFWLAPEWRDGLLGLRLLRSVLQALKMLRVQAVRWETNDTFEPGPDGRSRVVRLLARLGFKSIGTVMQRLL